ncbi:MAG: sugar phosphate isomerase/epimerase family protein [Methanospirillum sp.]
MHTRFAVSSFCLIDMPLEMALGRLCEVTDCVEVMDEGCHRLKDISVLETFDLQYMVHAPSRGVNIASLLEPVRRASVEVTVECLALSTEIEAPVVVHPGYYAWRQDRKRAERQFRLSLAELLSAAEDLSATFYIENMGDWEHFLLKTPDELPLIDGAGFALDVGHAHQNHVLPEFLEVPINHFHLHDNDGTTDAHAAIGDGTIDFSAVMAAVRRSGARPVIEVGDFEGIPRSIAALEAL